MTLPLPQIRPISDLRTDLNDVCAMARESQEPIFMTKNGKASLVVIDCEAYENQRQRDRYVQSLREAEIEARYHHGKPQPARRHDRAHLRAVGRLMRTPAFRPRAALDLESLVVYLGEVLRSPQAARDTYAAILDAFDRLCEMPTLGRSFLDDSLEAEA